MYRNIDIGYTHARGRIVKESFFFKSVKQPPKFIVLSPNKKLGKTRRHLRLGERISLQSITSFFFSLSQSLTSYAFLFLHSTLDS